MLVWFVQRTYKALIEPPSDGRWVTFFIDIRFHNKDAHPIDPAELFKNVKRDRSKMTVAQKLALDNWGGFPHDFVRDFAFTTEVSVMPNTFPYPDCNGADCGSRLV